MKLPGISDLIGKHDDKDEIIASFIVGKNWIQAGLWRITDGKCEIISTGSTDSWQDTESFVGAADDSLSSAIGSVDEPPEEIKSVVFGLPSEWIEEGSLKPQRLLILKSLCDKLELVPLGFVVIPEALIHFLRDKEGAPASTILVGIEEEEMEVMLVRAGKILNAQTVSRSISLPDDITEGLTRFITDSKEPLPPRIILSNRHKSSLEEAAQNLLTFEWPKDFFLHAPRIEYLTPEDQILAVSSAAASELMGVVPTTKLSGENDSEEEIINSPATPESNDRDDDESKEEQGKPEQVTEISKEPDIIESSSVNSEVVNVHLPPEQLVTEPLDTAHDEQDVGYVRKLLSIFTPVILFKNKLLQVSAGGRRIKLFLGFFVFVSFVIGLFWWFLPSATVNVYISPRKIEEKITLSVDPTGREGKDVVPGRVISVGVSGEKTRSATGARTVGERARGEITIYNNTSQSKTFSPGTLLTNGTGLKFTLDTPITVASESGAPTYVPGQTKATIIGADIGAEYNLGPGNIFQIANFSTSTFSGKNDNVLTGGSSREVSAVGRDDQNKLEEELLAELKAEVENKISGQINDKEKVIGESAKVEISKKSFSASVGDEAQVLKLSMAGEGRVVVVSREKLNEKLLGALSGKVPADFSLSSENITVAFGEVSEEKTGIMKLGANVVGNLLPNIDVHKLAKEIKGKSPTKVKEELAKIPGYARTTIKLSLSPPLLSNLPQRAQRIAIKVLAEQ